MKKVLKIIGIILLGVLIAIGIVLYHFRGQIKFYINAAQEYSDLKNNLESVEVTKDLNMSKDMDYKDIEYKKSNGKAVTLDIYEAKKKLKGGSPVILYVHGGSWIYGNSQIPELMEPLLNVFRNEGYAIISVNYRLTTNEIDFYKQVSDVKDAIRWVYKNKDKYDFNTNEIGLVGASAGAHLSLLAAYSGNNEFKDDKALDNYPSKVKWVVDLFGPTNLNSLNMRIATDQLETAVKNRENSLRGKQSIENYMKEYSPINYVKPDLPPTLIIHGTNDKMVPYKDSLELYEKSKKDGNNVELLTLDNGGHDFSNINKKQILDLGVKFINFIIFNTNLN